MEKVFSFKGSKEVVRVTSSSEIRLPEYSDMRRIYLRSKQEVDRALARGNKVYQQSVEGDFGKHNMVYIEVPFDKVIDLINQ